MDRNKAHKLGLDLLNHHWRSRSDDRNPRDTEVPVGLGNCQALDIVATTRKQADDPCQHARLIIHQNGDDMAFDYVGFVHLDLFSPARS